MVGIFLPWQDPTLGLTVLTEEIETAGWRNTVFWRQASLMTLPSEFLKAPQATYGF